MSLIQILCHSSRQSKCLLSVRILKWPSWRAIIKLTWCQKLVCCDKTNQWNAVQRIGLSTHCPPFQSFQMGIFLFTSRSAITWCHMCLWRAYFYSNSSSILSTSEQQMIWAALLRILLFPFNPRLTNIFFVTRLTYGGLLQPLWIFATNVSMNLVLDRYWTDSSNHRYLNHENRSKGYEIIT